MRGGTQNAYLHAVDSSIYAGEEATVTTEEFRNLSVMAQLVIPHDWAGLVLRSPAGGDAHVFLTAGKDGPNAAKELSLPAESEDTAGRIMTADDARASGFDAGVQVPIRVANEREGMLTFLIRRPQAYGGETLQHARTLPHTSQRCSHDDAVRCMSEQLLRLLADARYPGRFPRVSEIVAAAIPHDRLVFWLFDDSGHMRVERHGPSKTRRWRRILDPVDEGFRLIGDLPASRSRSPICSNSCWPPATGRFWPSTQRRGFSR